MKNMIYQPIIGMEIHVELKTQSKMFCGCKNDPFHAERPNIYTCPVCLGLPGALPVANKKAIEWTIKLGLALNCRINYFSKFDRKHYFYPDLPKGYQISQYDLPFCYDGYIETSEGKIRIRRIHLEEDTAKLIHKDLNGKKMTLIDFNRSSVPLIEIVTEPDIHSPSQAKEYGKKLHQIIRYLDISDADMEKGGMRLEANVSLQNQKSKFNPKLEQSTVQGCSVLNTVQSKNQKLELPNYKVELKNINSFRFLERAIEMEIERQKELLEKGEIPVQETRGYNASKNITFSQRSKESAEDYRYFPDPDLPPVRITDDWLVQIRSEMPMSLDDYFSFMEKTYQVKKEMLELLFETYNEGERLKKLLEKTHKEINPQKLINFLVKNQSLVKKSNEEIIAEFKKQQVVSDVSDEELENVVKKVLLANPKALEDYKNGKTNAINFFYGQIVKELKKRVEFRRVVEKIDRIKHEK